MNAYDKIMDKRIQMGKFQYKVLTSVGFIHFVSASELVIMQILLSVLQNEWNLTNQQIILLPFINYWGLFAGSCACSFGADKIGRKNILILFSIFQIVGIMVNSVATTYNMLIFVFFIYGSIYGLAGPCGSIVLTEFTPQKYKGKVVIVYQLLTCVGMLYCTFLCFIFMEDFGHGNWRGLVNAHFIPAFLTFFFLSFMIRESPKLYISQGQYLDGFDVLNEMGQTNHQNFNMLTKEEKHKLVRWQQITESNASEGLSSLFKKNQISTTIKIYMLFSLHEFHRALQALMPLYFYDLNLGFYALLFPYLAEFTGVLLMYFFMGNQAKKVTLILCIFMMLMVLGVMLIRHKYMIMVIFICNRWTQRVLLSCFYIIGTGSFSTLQASIGIGTSLAIARINGAFIQYLLVYTFYIEQIVPFVMLAVASGVMIVIVLSLKK